MKPVRNFTLALIALSIASILLFEGLPQIKYNLEDPIYHRLKQRIFSKKPEKFDVAFIGTSHIWQAVNTELINQKRPGKFVYNFGVNWFGNDTKQVIVRDLLNHKPVRKLVLEIKSSDDTERHEYFKFLAAGKDLMQTARHTYSNLGLKDFATISPEFRKRSENLVTIGVPFTVKGLYFSFREFVWKVPPVEAADHDGFLPTRNVYDFTDKSFSVTTADDSNSKVNLSPALRNIAQLCRDRGVDLYFLFVPERNEPYPGPVFLTELRKLGKPIILDSNQYYAPQYWYDPRHLNIAGATVFTEMLLASELFASPHPISTP